MRTRLLFVGFALTLAVLWVSYSEAFEIPYPGEDGFFIGRPMVYVITADSSSDENIGEEGVFTFGPGRVTIDGREYYDYVFDSLYGDMHFYLRLDSLKGDMIQKGVKVGTSELTLDPAVTGVDYPLAPGDSWSEETDLTVVGLEIPGFPPLDIPITVRGVEGETKASSSTISVPAGTFDTLLVESTFDGKLMGIPMTLIQRTWLSEENVAVKRGFEVVALSTKLMEYEVELSKLTPTPWDVNWDGVVNILDAVIVGKHFGERIAQPRVRNPDVDGNGVVDIPDLAKVGAHFGERYNMGAPAKYSPNDVCSADLTVLGNLCQEIEQRNYRVSSDDLTGLRELFNVLDLVLQEHLPRPVVKNTLFQSFPNPCNPEVWIPYALAADSSVMIDIYSVSGQLVRELELGYKPAGVYTSKAKAAHWDGRNQDGEKAASGVYFYTMRAGEFSAAGRMLVSR